MLLDRLDAYTQLLCDLFVGQFINPVVRNFEDVAAFFKSIDEIDQTITQFVPS